MAKDTFKSHAPTLEFFRDGEVLRGRKIGQILDDVQDGFEVLSSAIGDLASRADVLVGRPLYINSLGRSLGSMDAIAATSFRRFAAYSKTKSELHQGLVSYPWSLEASPLVGTTSPNLLPSIDQTDRIGVGCISDDGRRCRSGYDAIYDADKAIHSNVAFTASPALSGWDAEDVYNAPSSPAYFAQQYRFNFITYSEDFSQWITEGAGVLTPDSYPSESFGLATYKFEPDATGPQALSLAISGTELASADNYTFSLWVASSCATVVHLEVSSTTTTVIDIEGSAGGAKTSDNYWSIPVSGLTPTRIYVSTTFAANTTASNVTARIHFALGERIESDTDYYLYGAQLNTNSSGPSSYLATSGVYGSRQNTWAKLSRTLDVIPYHTYQARIEVATVHASMPMQFLVDNTPVATLVSGENIIAFTPESASATVAILASGTTYGPYATTVNRFGIDARTPCQAMRCPEFSAYHEARTYRITLPKVTDPSRQSFGEQLTIAPALIGANRPDLPGGSLGIFDHVQNHAGPGVATELSRGTWNPDLISLPGFVIDPDFLGSWTTNGGDTYPSELTPFGTGTISRDTDGTAVGSTTPADRMILAAPVAGNSKGIQKEFTLRGGQVYAWTYRVRGNLSYAGCQEKIRSTYGSVEFDSGDHAWIDASTLDRMSQISGIMYPGIDATTERVRGGWQIRRHLRTTDDQAQIILGLAISGNGTGQTLEVDSFDLTPLEPSAIDLRYRGDGLLAEDWWGPADPVLEENLVQWNEDPVLWDSNSSGAILELDLDGPTGSHNAFRLTGAAEYAGFLIPQTAIRADTMTVQFYERAAVQTATTSGARLEVIQNAATLLSAEWTPTAEWTRHGYLVSGITATSGLMVRFRPPDPGDILALAEVQVHHGSGLVTYVQTDHRTVTKYGTDFDTRMPHALDNIPYPGYGVAFGHPVTTHLVADSTGKILQIEPSGTHFSLFPDAGVVKVGSQSFAYRAKTSNAMTYLRPGWNGSSFTSGLLTSGLTATLVPIAQPVLSFTGSRVTFENPVPLSFEHPNSAVELHLFGHRATILNRFSLISASLSVARTAGSVMTAFLSHAADHQRHFRRDQICSSIIDPSPIANIQDMEISLTASKTEMSERTESVTLKVIALGFPTGTNKQVTVLWGDGNTDIVTGTGRLFQNLSHIYDLGSMSFPIFYTILVQVEDLDLRLLRSGSTHVLINPAPKGVQASRAVVSLTLSKTQQAGAMVTAVGSKSQTSSAIIISP